MMASLSMLDLSDNQLSGSISTSIGNLTKLTVTELILLMNKLTSSLPLEINNLTNFISQQLGYNNFIGHLPQHICLAGSLEYLGAINNHFTGPTLKSLKNCTSLVRV